MLEKKCCDFINELGSSAPVPGGGSSSALVAAIGISLGTMVGELTSGKKGYEQYEAEISNLIYRSRELTKAFEESVIEDTEAFSNLMNAYRMPASTESEKKLKSDAVQKNLIHAIEAPLNLAELCVKALRVLDSYSLIGNKSALTDAGTGAALCEAALKGANLNVLVNIKMLDDQELKRDYMAKIDAAVDTGIHLAGITYARVEKANR